MAHVTLVGTHTWNVSSSAFASHKLIQEFVYCHCMNLSNKFITDLQNRSIDFTFWMRNTWLVTVSREL